MDTPNLGNTLYRLVTAARHGLFSQGEEAQLTYNAFGVLADNVSILQEEIIEIPFPIGYRPDKTSILGRSKYKKEDLLGRYQYLAHRQLPANCLVQLVTIVGALLGDVVRTVVTRYPQKLGSKRAVQLQTVLEAQSLEEIHLRATDSLLNDLSYKSPVEFANALDELLSVKLLECPAFHKYVEVKATRDIYIHNRRFTNDTYLRKAGVHARAKAGQPLPVDVPYFLESYESCIQLTEWLENELHQRWHSSEREDYQAQQAKAAQQSSAQTGSPPAEDDSKPGADTSETPKETPKRRRRKPAV